MCLTIFLNEFSTLLKRPFFSNLFETSPLALIEKRPNFSHNCVCTLSLRVQNFQNILFDIEAPWSISWYNQPALGLENQDLARWILLPKVAKFGKVKAHWEIKVLTILRSHCQYPTDPLAGNMFSLDCNSCGETFIRMAELRKHTVVQHYVRSNQSVKRKSIFAGIEMDKRNSKEARRSFLLVFTCNFCPDKFTRWK